MRARVKQTSNIPLIRSAGLWWNNKEWKDVPPKSEREILANPYLETQSEPEPVAVDATAAKLVVTQPGRGKGKRKL